MPGATSTRREVSTAILCSSELSFSDRHHNICLVLPQEKRKRAEYLSLMITNIHIDVALLSIDISLEQRWIGHRHAS